MENMQPRLSFWLSCFAVGVVLSLVIPGFSQFSVAPLLVAWRVVAAICGSQVADAHVWAPRTIAALFHGLAATALGWCLDKGLRMLLKTDTIHMGLRVAVVAVAYCLLLIFGLPIASGDLP